MKTVTWTSPKSLIMQEMRVALKKKAEPGQPSPSRKEANRTWREDILGILSNEQKSAKKASKQQAQKRKAARELDSED